MSWYWLVILSVLASAATTTLIRAVLTGKHKIDYYTMSFLTCVFTAACLFLYVCLAGFTMPPLGDMKLIFFVNITIGLIGQITFQKGLSELGAGEFTILMTSRQVVTWVASILLLSAGLTLGQGVGSILIIIALLVVFGRKDVFKSNSGSGVFFTMLTALNWGFGFLIDLLIYRRSDPASYLLIAYTLTALLLFIIKPKVLRRSLKMLADSRRFGAMLGIGIMSALNNVLLFAALKKANNAPLVSGLFQIQIIVSVLFGLILLKEHDRAFNKLIGAVLSTIGAVLMIIK